MSLKRNLYNWYLGKIRQKVKHYMAVYERREARELLISRRNSNHNYARKGDKDLTPEQLAEVKKFWRKYRFAYTVDPNTAKTYYNRSEIFDPRYFPFELKNMLREVMLDKRFAGVEAKTFLPKQLVNANLPRTVVAMFDGIFYDGKYNIISKEDAIKLLVEEEEELVYKPTRETSGGKGIYFMHKPSAEEVEDVISKMGGGMIVQCAIKQHPMINEFNDSTVNTVRVTSYYRGGTEVVILATLMKVGGKGVRVDNYKQGGCVIGIDYETGKFNDWALASNYGRITKLPSGIDLKEKELYVPGFDKLKEMVINTHLGIPHNRLISWDIGIKEDGEPVVIEINFGGDLRMHQIVTGPVFREYTEEIMNEVLLKNYYRKDSLKEYDIHEYHNHIEIVKYCGKASNVVVPERIRNKPVTKILQRAFDGNETIIEVELPKTVKSIGMRAFNKCVNLKKFTFDGDLNFCGKYVFAFCRHLKDVNVSDNIKAKYPKAFIR